MVLTKLALSPLIPHPSFPSQLCGERAVLLPKAGPWFTATLRTVSHSYMGLALSYPNPVFCIQQGKNPRSYRVNTQVSIAISGRVSSLLLLSGPNVGRFIINHIPPNRLRHHGMLTEPSLCSWRKVKTGCFVHDSRACAVQRLASSSPFHLFRQGHPRKLLTRTKKHVQMFVMEGLGRLV